MTQPQGILAHDNGKEDDDEEENDHGEQDDDGDEGYSE
jgi:hypothetical protein